jgi:Rieske Fe-S protein
MSLFEDPSRRRFIKAFVLGTASGLVLGKPWRAAVLAQATPAAGVNLGTLPVRISEYPSLAQEFGSVRLGLNPIYSDSSGPIGFFYPILINRGLGNTFYAMDSGCSHAGCVVPPFDVIENAMVCPCHGSRYEIDGTVHPDQPASSSLTRYNLEYDGGDLITIQVPFLGYSVTALAVQSALEPRLLLDFPTKLGVEYEVHFRQRMQDAWTVIPFSTTLDGPEDTMSVIGNELNASVYVSRTRATGFYAVSIKILNLTEL